MPELPEVETTRLGILPSLRGRRVSEVRLRERRLRWPVEPALGALLTGVRLDTIDRRAKYLLFRFGDDTLLVHLGMSGSLRLLHPADQAPPPRPHDHIDLFFEGQFLLRYHDPRRFGCMLWIAGDAREHPLLRSLGPEPLQSGFDGALLFDASRRRRTSVKQFLMDGEVVVGVGNIYASEALFRAGIDPRRAAGRVSLARYGVLAAAVRSVLAESIATGGTTLRDYVNGNGHPGEFALRLNVYDREGEACTRCGSAVRQTRLGQRSTYFCIVCQR